MRGRTPVLWDPVGGARGPGDGPLLGDTTPIEALGPETNPLGEELGGEDLT